MTEEFKTQVWIVMGSTGEYSDRTDWNVDAWTTEEAAINRVANLDRLMLELGLSRLNHSDYISREAESKKMKEHPDGDPNFQRDYTGTSYSYSMVELRV